MDPRGFHSRHDERIAFLERIPVTTSGEDTLHKDEASAVERVYGSSFSLHPFFGYTFRASYKGANNLGFYSGGPEFPYHPAPRELVVGIFGGSVAMQVAGARERIVAALEPVARAHGYERVTALSFAIGGWRQPQQFNALVRFVDDIDVAVVVDGFNEVIHLGDWHLQRQPAEFPWSAVYGALARQPSAEEELQRADLIRTHLAAARMTRRLDWPILRASALAHLAWRVYAARYEAKAAAARDALTRGAVDHDLQPDMTAEEVSARRTAYLDWWRELILFSEVISHTRGRLFFHFIQPNQYDRGAKPLSAEERESFTRNTSWFDEVTPRYAHVKLMIEELQRAGIDSTYLGDLFATTAETVYVDDCCHLNEHGIAMLTDAVAQHIVTSPEIERLPLSGAARTWPYVAGSARNDATASAHPLPSEPQAPAAAAHPSGQHTS